jgi:hypothetical protein
VKAEYITSLAIALILAACAHQQTVEVSEYHITNTAEKCAGKTACSEVYDTGKCNVWINAKATTEKDYGAAVRKCFAGRA